jgi:hypothetical protein
LVRDTVYEGQADAQQSQYLAQLFEKAIYINAAHVLREVYSIRIMPLFRRFSLGCFEKTVSYINSQAYAISSLV